MHSDSLERPERLNALIKSLRDSGFRPKAGDVTVGITEELLSEVSSVLGCEGGFSTCLHHPNESDGPLIDAVQVRVAGKLKRRVEVLELQVSNLGGDKDGR